MLSVSLPVFVETEMQLRYIRLAATVGSDCLAGAAGGLGLVTFGGKVRFCVGLWRGTVAVYLLGKLACIRTGTES